MALFRARFVGCMRTALTKFLSLGDLVVVGAWPRAETRVERSPVIGGLDTTVDAGYRVIKNGCLIFDQ